jgi:hypothetical protein
MRFSQRPASATRARPSSAGGGDKGGVRAIRGLTCPWTGKMRWASHKELEHAEMADATVPVAVP